MRLKTLIEILSGALLVLLFFLPAHAQSAFERGDWPAAIGELQKQLAATPANADLRLKLGIAQLASGQPVEAIASFQHALKLRPTMIPARQYLAAALAEAGDCAQGVPMLKKEMPRIANPELKRTAGLAAVRCAAGANRHEDAIEFIQILTRAFPKDPEVLYQAVHLYSDLSLKASQEMLIHASSSYQLRLLNAEALETQERWAEAESEYRAVLAQQPGLPGIHYRIGRLLLSLPEGQATPEKRQQAREEFEAEVKLNPRNAGAEYVLGELARQSRDWPRATAHFSNAAKLNPNFADAFIGWGRALIADRKFAEAIAPLERAVKLEPNHPASHFHLAIAYSRSGRREDGERESAVFKEVSERARQMKQDVQTGILGPQRAEP